MQEKQFHKSYARELLAIAEADLVTAEVLVTAKKGRPENVLFILQQVVEKGIKAVLCSQGLPVPLSHDIEALIVRLSGGHPPHLEALLDLTPYATIRRYEEGRFEITKDEQKNVLEIVTDFLDWARKEIGASS